MADLKTDTLSYLAFIDGACSGNPGPGGWGSVILNKQNNYVVELGGGSDQSTNNIMELTGLLETLKFLQSQNSESALYLKVYMDSQYVLNGAHIWRHGWKKKGWRKSDNSPVMNLEIWKTLDQILEKLKSQGCVFDWHHIKAHAGNPANERVDEIAVSFSKKLPPNLFKGPLAELPYDLKGSAV